MTEINVSQPEPPNLEAAVEKFKAAATRYLVGAFFDNQSVQEDCVDEMIVALEVMKHFGPAGRQALVEMLDHENNGVRVHAANELLTDRPDLAMPVLEELSAGEYDDSATVARACISIHGVYLRRGLY